MKIVELITFLAGGGAERFVVDLSNQLSKDHSVCLVTLLNDKKEPEVRNFYRSELSDNVQYINAGLPNGLKLSSQWKVYSLLRKLNPDVIHIHLIPSLKYSALAIGLLSITKKVYFSVHSDLHNGYDEGLFKLYCNTLGVFNKFKLSCLSEKNYEDFRSFYPQTPIKCITNGRAPVVPANLFDAVKDEISYLRSNEHTMLLIHVARCHPVKNQKLLIDAVNSIVDSGYNIDLIVIGAGFDTSDGKVLVSEACSRVHFIGVKKNVSDYMLNSNIFCLSSDFEGMPISLIEASLAGVPAVSTPVCGAVDLIMDGQNGYLSKSHSLEDYKAALIKAIDNYGNIKAKAMEMKDNSPYTIKECANKYVAFFNE